MNELKDILRKANKTIPESSISAGEVLSYVKRNTSDDVVSRRRKLPYLALTASLVVVALAIVIPVSIINVIDDGTSVIDPVVDDEVIAIGMGEDEISSLLWNQWRIGLATTLSAEKEKSILLNYGHSSFTDYFDLIEYIDENQEVELSITRRVYNDSSSDVSNIHTVSLTLKEALSDDYSYQIWTSTYDDTKGKHFNQKPVYDLLTADDLLDAKGRIVYGLMLKPKYDDTLSFVAFDEEDNSYQYPESLGGHFTVSLAYEIDEENQVVLSDPQSTTDEITQ